MDVSQHTSMARAVEALSMQSGSLFVRITALPGIGNHCSLTFIG